MTLIFSLFHLEKLTEAKDDITDVYTPSLLHIEQIRNSLQETNIFLQGYIDQGDELQKVAITNIWKENLVISQEKLKYEIAQFSDKETKDLFIPISSNLHKLQLDQLNIAQRVTDELKNTGYYRISFTMREDTTDEIPAMLELLAVERNIQRQLKAQVLPTINAINIDATKLQTQIQNKIIEATVALDSHINSLKLACYSCFLLSVIMGIGLGLWLVRNVVNNLKHIKDVVKEISSGNIPELVPENRNETNIIIRQINILIGHLGSVKELAVKVGQGEFSHNISVFNNEGELGESLSGMKESLGKVALEDKQRNWVNHGYTHFVEIMRSNTKNTVQLCEEFIGQLVKYVGANQGAIFLVQDEEGHEPYLKLASCFAYNRKKYFDKKILKGEGLAGQSWQEKDTLYLTDIPQDYLQIKSGIGGSSPKCILMVPIATNDEVVGILEIAAFKPIENFEIEFIKKIAESLAASISTNRNNEKTEILLLEAQNMTEEMRAQEEEMRQNMEELEATQEEMQRAQQEMRQKEANLNGLINNTEDTIFAIDKDYKITIVNTTLRAKYAAMNINLEVGSNIFDLLPKDKWEIWKERYDRALAGESYVREEEVSGSYGKQFSHTYHNPIKDEMGNIVGASVISRDVTEMMLAKQNTQQRELILHSLMNIAEDGFIAIDKDYKVTMINETLRERLAKFGAIVAEGDNIFEKIAKEKHQLWKDIYDSALKGESFSTQQELQLHGRKVYMEELHAPILDGEGQVIGASTMSRDITALKEAIEALQESEKEILTLQKFAGDKNATVISAQAHPLPAEPAKAKPRTGNR